MEKQLKTNTKRRPETEADIKDVNIELGLSIDQIVENTAIGSLEKAIGNNLYGVNARTKRSYLPKSRNSQGYVFFTRPMLNLTDMNVSNVRKFISLLRPSPQSYATYVRMMLDPRLARNMGLHSPFVNNESAFIPLLTNNLLNLSGWPDDELPTFTTSPGHYGEQITLTDGHTNQYEAFDLTGTFRDTRGNPLLYLLSTWYYYQTYVFQGMMQPYFDMVLENEVDYHTCIYRIITDPTNRYVTNIARTGWAMPNSLPLASIFDYNVENSLADTSADLDVRFKCNMFFWGEDIIKLEFNKVQTLFSPSMRRLLIHDMTSKKPDDIRREDVRKTYFLPDTGLAKVPHHMLQVTEQSYNENTYFKLSHSMLPYINLATNELEWWAPKELVFRGKR